jgi:hypothetical protein
VIAIKNRSGFVPTDFHRFLLAETRLDHIGKRGPPQIMKERIIDARIIRKFNRQSGQRLRQLLLPTLRGC